MLGIADHAGVALAQRADAILTTLVSWFVVEDGDEGTFRPAQSGCRETTTMTAETPHQDPGSSEGSR